MKYKINGPIDKDTCELCKEAIGKEYNDSTGAHSALETLMIHHTQKLTTTCRCTIEAVGSPDLSAKTGW